MPARSLRFTKSGISSGFWVDVSFMPWLIWGRKLRDMVGQKVERHDLCHWIQTILTWSVMENMISSTLLLLVALYNVIPSLKWYCSKIIVHIKWQVRLSAKQVVSHRLRNIPCFETKQHQRLQLNPFAWSHQEGWKSERLPLVNKTCDLRQVAQASRSRVLMQQLTARTRD